MHRSSINRLAAILYSADALLVTMFVFCIVGSLTNPITRQLFDLDAEASIPAWFSSAQLLAAGIVFATRYNLGPHRSVGRSFFLLWSLALFFLSADEGVGFHEKISIVFRHVEFLPRFSGNHGIWIPLYAVAGTAFIAIVSRPSLRLWRSGNRGVAILFIGVIIFVCGAVLVEIIGYGELREAINHRDYQIQVAVEEGLELTGISTILIGGILTCYAENTSQGDTG